MTLENLNTIQQGIQHLNAGNATPVQMPIVIPPAIPEQFVFQSGGLQPATQPQPYVAPIMSTESVPDLNIQPIVQPPVELPMPSVAEPDEIIQEFVPPPSNVVEQPVVVRKKKVGILDRITNTIYKIIFKK